MAVGDKYHAADTNYEKGEAEWPAEDFQHQIVNDSDDIIALFGDAKERDHVLALLNANPFPE
jgi:hypothetical protein